MSAIRRAVGLFILLLWRSGTARAGEDRPRAWYERFEIGGYAQLRYDRLVASSDAPANEVLDRAFASPARISLRRARLRLEGDPVSLVHLYLQTELAGVVGEAEHVVELRDFYAEVSLDREKELRLRAGLTKVPYGFENLQSSQDRAPFERSDAINSATSTERDLGVYATFAPRGLRERFAELADGRHKGAGDLGVVAVGVFNGQGPNAPERNANKHVIARVAYPFAIGGVQMLELSGGGYTGRYVTERSSGVGGPRDVRDVRVHAAVVLYPRPLGFQAEYNVGVGPELADGAVVERPLGGGYVMAIAHVGPTFPYARGQYYDGGWKASVDSPRREVLELETGLEWRLLKNIELTGAYVESRRTTGGRAASGRAVRVQLQLEY